MKNELSSPKVLIDVLSWPSSATSSDVYEPLSSSSWRGSGVAPPFAALDHAASRNSSAVFIRSIERNLIRSSSIKTIRVVVGRNVMSGAVSVKTPESDSMPSTYIPFAIRPHISCSSGNL